MSDLPTADRGPVLKSRAMWLRLIALLYLVPGAIMALSSVAMPGATFDPFALALPVPAIAIGIGLWRARRWAAFVTRVAATLMLVNGFAFLPVLWTLWGVESGASVPSSGMDSTLPRLLDVILMGMIAVPAAVVRLLARKDVREVIENRDPGPSRTDRLDHDVVGLGLGMLGVGLGYLKGMVMFGIPFDTSLPTLAGAAAVILFSTIMSGLLFRRHRAGWWCAITVLLLPIVFRGIAGLLGARMEAPTFGPPPTPGMMDALSFSPWSQFLAALSALPWLVWLYIARARFWSSSAPTPSGPTPPLGLPPEPAGPAPDAAIGD